MTLPSYVSLWYIIDQSIKNCVLFFKAHSSFQDTYYTQYFVITYKGKESGKNRHIFVYN